MSGAQTVRATTGPHAAGMLSAWPNHRSDWCSLLVSPSGALPKLFLERVDEPKTTKNRMHPDIETPDVEAEVPCLEGIGARRLGTESRTEHGTRWVIMADPEDNECCVCDGGQGGAAPSV
jgi:hypothetical protein